MIDDLELMTLRRQDAAELYAEQPGAVAAQEAGEPPDFLLSCLVENVSELSGVCVCVCMFVCVCVCARAGSGACSLLPLAALRPCALSP